MDYLSVENATKVPYQPDKRMIMGTLVSTTITIDMRPFGAKPKAKS